MGENKLWSRKNRWSIEIKGFKKLRKVLGAIAKYTIPLRCQGYRGTESGQMG